MHIFLKKIENRNIRTRAADRFEQWAEVNKMEFNGLKKCKIQV